MKFSEVTACTIALMKWRAETRQGPVVTPQPAAHAARLAADPPPPEWDELRRFLLAQPPATLILLTAVVYIGADQCEPGRLLEMLLRLGRTFQTRTALVDVLAGRPLAEYLSEGLRKLTAARVNLDRLHGG